jgi:alkylhydroperoxidase family enzyme
MPIASYDWQSETASPDSAQLAEAEAARAGRVTNMKGVLLHSAPAFRLFSAVLPLKESLRATLGARAVDVFSLAISEDSHCLLCSLYFRRALKAHGVNPDEYVPTEDEAALIDIAHRIAGEPAVHRTAPPLALEALRDKYGPETVVAIVSYGSAMLATNRLNTTLGIPIDDDLLPSVEAAEASAA